MRGPVTQLQWSSVFPSRVFIPELLAEIPQRSWTEFPHHICSSYQRPKERKAPPCLALLDSHLQLGWGGGRGGSCGLSNTLALLLRSPQELHALVHIPLDASSNTQTQTSFCRRGDLLKGCEGAPRYGTWEGRDRSSSGGLGASTCQDFLHFLFLLLPAYGLCSFRLAFSGGRNQGHQQPLAHIFLFCHERAKGLSLLVPG